MKLRRPTLPRPRWLVLSAVLLVAGTAALSWAVSASSLLAVREIEVSYDMRGQHRVSRPRVVAVARVPEGKPLARVDLGAVGGRVTGLRVVESVHVRRVWPSTVRIRVRERVAIAAVPHDSGYALLDDEGVRLATVSKPPDDLPVVDIEGPAESGAAASSATEANGTALDVLRVLPRRLADAVEAVSVGWDGEVALRMRDGAKVVWGTPERGREKVRVLRVLLKRTDARIYDVSSPDVATTTR